MKTLNKSIIMIAMVAFTQIAAAVCVQKSNVVGFMGIDGADRNIFVSVSGHNNQCHCNTVRFKSSKTDTNAVLSILLAARMSKTTVRIDFDDDKQCNTAFRVYLH